MKKVIKRYLPVLLVLIGVGVIFIIDSGFGKEALGVTAFSIKEMLLVLPPIFILLGLLDVWVPKETMVRFMGEGSGIKGILLALLLGSAAAGPLYGAFPVAAVFMKKGAKFTNVLIFIGAWSTTKIPMILFEVAGLGARFAITRLLIDIPGIIIIAYLLAFIMPKKTVEGIYEKAGELG